MSGALGGLMEIVHFIVDTGSGTGPSSGPISSLSVLGPTGPASCTRPYSLVCPVYTRCYSLACHPVPALLVVQLSG